MSQAPNYEAPQRLITHVGQRIHHYGFLALALHTERQRRGFAGFFATKILQQDYCRYGVCGYFDTEQMDKPLRARFKLSVWEKLDALSQDIRAQLNEFSMMVGPTTFSQFVEATEKLELHSVAEASICLVRSKVVTSGAISVVEDRYPLFYPLGLMVGACANSPDMMQTPIPMLNLYMHLRGILPRF